MTMTHEPPASVEREKQALRNVLADIARQGDMPIEVAAPALELIYRRLGFSWQVEEETREIDAMALEALAKLALSTPPARPGREEIAALSCAGGLFEHISGRWGVRWGDVELLDEYQFRPKAMEKLGQLRADAILALFDGASA